MGAGGGIWETARAELLRPGLSAGGAGISIVFSAGRGTGGGAGTMTDGAGFLPVTAAGAILTCAAGLAAFAATLGAGLAGVFTVFWAIVLATAAGFLETALATGFASFTPALPFASAVLAGLALAAAFAAAFTTGFFLATTAGLAGFAAGFTGALDFFAGTFTVCLLWKPPLDKPRS